MEDRKIRVAITHGDTNGIGYELIFKTFEDPAMFDLCTPVIYGSPKVATYHSKALNIQANFSIVANAGDAQDGRLNMLAAFEDDVKVEFGKPSEESGMAALKAVDRALEDYSKGLVDVIVTAPVENNEVFRFSGQPLYIADHLVTGVPSKGSMSVLCGERLRVALATRNLPLRQVADSLSLEFVNDTVKSLHHTLRRDFLITNPRIAVLALNPKAGDDGIIGSEENELLKPVISSLVEEGIQVYGPYPADTFFDEGFHGSFDVVLAMYYDQGMMPFRMIEGEDGVLFESYMPVVCTSPTHGVRFDIAGTGNANPSSMRHAVYLAVDVFRNRKFYDESYSNPLKKLYKERRDESEKVRFAVPKPREDVKH